MAPAAPAWSSSSRPIPPSPPKSAASVSSASAAIASEVGGLSHLTAEMQSVRSSTSTIVSAGTRMPLATG